MKLTISMRIIKNKSSTSEVINCLNNHTVDYSEHRTVNGVFVIARTLIFNCPLLKDISSILCILSILCFNTLFVGLVWLISNHMFGSGQFWDKSPSKMFWNCFRFIRAFSKFSKMHSGNLSQIVLPNVTNYYYYQ